MLWKLGKFSERFELLKKIQWDHDGSPATASQEITIRNREVWIAGNREGKDLDTVINQMQWLAIGANGIAYMSDLLAENMEKIDSRKQKKSVFITQLEKLAAYEAAGGIMSAQARWDSWIEKQHSPTENKLLAAAQRYLKGAAKRYGKRLKEQAKGQAPKHYVYPKKTMITSWRDLLDKAKERELLMAEIQGIWMNGWQLSGQTVLEEIFRLAKKDIPDGLIFGAPELAVSEIGFSVDEIVDTSSKVIQKTIEDGLLSGWSVAEIATSISRNPRFDRASALRIARTESTRALNLGASQSFKSAAAEGIRVKKKWLPAALPNVRPAHQALGEMDPIPVHDQWEIDGETADSPGSFGVAGLDINCRCTIIPIVE